MPNSFPSGGPASGQQTPPRPDVGQDPAPRGFPASGHRYHRDPRSPPALLPACRAPDPPFIRNSLQGGFRASSALSSLARLEDGRPECLRGEVFLSPPPQRSQPVRPTRHFLVSSTVLQLCEGRISSHSSVPGPRDRITPRHQTQWALTTVIEVK